MNIQKYTKKILLIFKYFFTNPKYLYKNIYVLIRYLIHKEVFLHKTKYNFNILLNSNNEVDKSIYLDNGFELYLIEFYKKYLKDDSVFIDVGTNIGLYSLLASTKITSGNIYSFEPDLNVYNQLLKSIKFNNISNIKTFNKGLNNKEGTLEFNIASDPAYNSLGKPHNHEILIKKKIDFITLDIFFNNSNESKIDFIKIDVEGAELNVLKGGYKTLKEEKPTLSIEISDETYKNFGYKSGDLFKYMIDLGYEVFNFKNLKLEKEEINNYYYYDNLIFIHKDNFKLFKVNIL